MADPLDTIEQQVAASRTAAPPLDQWHPPLSGDIDIVIGTDGEWRHEGDLFRRPAIVELFCSILRREDDGEYYLVTPVEKWRISVEEHALHVIDITRDMGSGILVATCRYGPAVAIGPEHPLKASTGSDVPCLFCNNGLTAGLARSVWYRLVDGAEERGDRLVVRSADWYYTLGQTDA